jgi:arginine decarboxylase
MEMHQAGAPVLDALAAYHRLGRYGFTPPGHRQGRGAVLDTCRAGRGHLPF